jgi:hypothetical protein
MKNTTLPELPSKIGKPGKLVMPPDGEVLHYTITDEIRLPQSDAPQKILCLQRIEFVKDKRVEVRLGYYIIGKLPKMRGKWVWGQFATFLPLGDFRKLIRLAEKKGWI